MSALNLKVRLPGSNTPVQTTVERATTASAFITHIATRYKISGLENRSVVIAPESGAHAKIIPHDAVIDVTSQSEVIELWASPYTINVGVSDGLSGMKESRELAVDISMPLTQMVPLFQRIFQSVNKELFVFRYLEADATETKILDDRWLNANLPLDQQNFNTEGWLVLYPVTALAHKISTDAPLKEGYMFKQTQKKGKYTKQNKKYFICKDFFLYYFNNKEDAHANGVLPLEYFYCKMETTRDGDSGKNKVSINLRLCLVGKTVKVGEEYVLTSIDHDNNKDMREWFDVLKPLCITGNDTRVFGVDLKEVASRKRESAIPIVVLKLVSYLKVKGMSMEGIFRISGSASLIEFYRDRLDQGIYVDLLNCTDVHTIASLLRQYLRELPDPLLTNDLHEQFVSSHEDQVSAEDRVKLALKAVEQLPDQNKAILYYLCDLLGRVSEHADVTRMTPSNLGTIFGMNISFGPQNDIPIEVILKKTPSINALMETLIVNHKKFLESPTFPTQLVPGLSDTVVDFEEEFRNAKPAEQIASPEMAPRKMSRGGAHLKHTKALSRDAENPICKDGWLERLSDVRKRWKRRYFVLTSDALHYYKSDKDTKPDGSISLHDCVVGTSNIRPFCLAFTTTSTRKNYYASASSQTEADEWFNLLNRIIRELNPNADFNATYAASPPKRIIYGGDDLSGYRNLARSNSPSVISSGESPIASPTPEDSPAQRHISSSPPTELANRHVPEPSKPVAIPSNESQTSPSVARASPSDSPKLGRPVNTRSRHHARYSATVVTAADVHTPESTPTDTDTKPEPFASTPEELTHDTPAHPPVVTPDHLPVAAPPTEHIPHDTPDAPASHASPSVPEHPPVVTPTRPPVSAPSTTPRTTPAAAPKLAPIAKPAAQTAVATKFALKPVANSPLPPAASEPAHSDDTPSATPLRPSALRAANALKQAGTPRDTVSSPPESPSKPAAPVLKHVVRRATSPPPVAPPADSSAKPAAPVLKHVSSLPTEPKSAAPVLKHVRSVTSPPPVESPSKPAAPVLKSVTPRPTSPVAESAKPAAPVLKHARSNTAPPPVDSPSKPAGPVLKPVARGTSPPRATSPPPEFPKATLKLKPVAQDSPSTTTSPPSAPSTTTPVGGATRTAAALKAAASKKPAESESPLSPKPAPAKSSTTTKPAATPFKPVTSTPKPEAPSSKPEAQTTPRAAFGATKAAAALKQPAATSSKPVGTPRRPTSPVKSGASNPPLLKPSQNTHH